MAWRKLLWNSKPAGRYGSHQPKKIKIYKKAGDFRHAMEDFLSVVPEDTLFKDRDSLNVSTIITRLCNFTAVKKVIFR